MRQLYAYVANEYTCHLKPIVDPPSILVVFFIDERSAKGTYAAFILRLYPRFWVLFLFMHLELLRSRMWVNINRPTTSRPRRFHKKSREASGAREKERRKKREKERSREKESQHCLWLTRERRCSLAVKILLATSSLSSSSSSFFSFYEYMTSARGQNRHSKFQFRSESVSTLLGHAYQFLNISVDYVRLFDFCIFSFRWLENCLESQR